MFRYSTIDNSFKEEELSIFFKHDIDIITWFLQDFLRQNNIPAGIDIPDTLNALKARYSLAAGLYAQALTAANAVDLTKKSSFNYDALSPNPIFDVATSTNNVVQTIDSTLGLLVPLQPDLSDGRVAFYTSVNPTIAPRFRIKGFGAATTTAFPVSIKYFYTLNRI